MKRPAWKRTLYVVAFTQFVALGGANLVFPFLPLFIQDLGVKNSRDVALYSGLGATGLGAMMFIFSPIWGALADRFGRKPLLMRAYVGVAIANGCQGLAQNVWQFLALRVVQGVFVGTVPAAAALIAASTPPERVAYGMGLLQMAQFTAATAGPLIGGLMADAFGFRQTFFMSGFFSAISALLLLFLVQENFVPPAELRSPAQTMAYNLRAVTASRRAVMVIGVLFMVSGAIALAQPVIPLLVEALHPDEAARFAGYAFAALALTSAGTAAFVGNFAQRLGYRRVLLVAMVGAGVTYLPVAAAGTVVALLLSLALIGCFSGGIIPTANSILSLTAPADKQGSVFGIAGSANALASAVGPLTGGLVASVLGIRSVFILSGGVILAATLVASRFVSEPRSSPEPGQRAVGVEAPASE